MAPRIVMKNIVVTLFAFVLAIVLETAQSEECVRVVNMSNPYLNSSDFPAAYGKECIWRFEARPGKRINLAFVGDFVLEKQENCNSEYVALYDGNSTNDALLGKFCGNKRPGRFISTSHRFLLAFRQLRNESKFKVQYSTGCNYFLKVTEDVHVVSPMYPYPYKANVLCAWEFETLPGHTIKLEFNYFAIDVYHKCGYDYVELYDGQSTKDDSLGRFCGTTIPNTVKSRTDRMLMIFRSDTSEQLKGFTATLKSVSEINKTLAHQIERSLTQYILTTKLDHIPVTNKWGSDITKKSVALFLQDPVFFAARNEIGEKIAYELTLQLMSKLVLKKRISTKDLALFVNAMTVSCIDPKNFFGLNIVAELRRRIQNSNRTNPFFLLALCIGGENMTTEDAQKLHHLFHTHLRSSWTEIQAMVVMALKCIPRQSLINLDTTLNQMASELKMKQQNNGTIDNLKNTALVVQALLATESYRTNFNLSMAINSIMEDTKRRHITTEEIFYTLPVFQWKTLLDINSNHCRSFIKTDLEVLSILREHSDNQIHVQISIIIGDDKDFTQTWRIKVPSDYSLYQVLENITSWESGYKIQYIISNGKPYIDGVANFRDSCADDSFWFIYQKPLSSTDELVLVNESPVDIKVNESEEIILWYRS